MVLTVRLDAEQTEAYQKIAKARKLSSTAAAFKSVALQNIDAVNNTIVYEARFAALEKMLLDQQAATVQALQAFGDNLAEVAKATSQNKADQTRLIKAVDDLRGAVREMTLGFFRGIQPESVQQPTSTAPEPAARVEVGVNLSKLRPEISALTTRSAPRR